MSVPILPDLPENRDAEIRRRWPLDLYPALYLSAEEYLVLRARQQQARELLELLGPHMADIALAILEDAHE